MARASAVMAESVKAGTIVDIPSLPTLSDATAGGIEHHLRRPGVLDSDRAFKRFDGLR